MSASTKTIPDGSNQLAPTMPVRIEAGAASHAGQVREINEDVYAIDLEQRLFVVADGMGGRSAGEVAAHVAVDALQVFCSEHRNVPSGSWPFPVDARFSIPVNLLRVGFKVANQKMLEEARKDPAWYRMGATIAALMIDDDHLVAAHAGDVRVYRIRGNSISRLTRDHSILEEMRSARPGLSTEELNALVNRNVITRALGSKSDLEPTVYTNAFCDGDMYLLCSDGLWDCIPDPTIASIVTAAPDVESACFALVDAANAAGAPDNVTALLVRVSR